MAALLISKIKTASDITESNSCFIKTEIFKTFYRNFTRFKSHCIFDPWAWSVPQRRGAAALRCCSFCDLTESRPSLVFQAVPSRRLCKTHAFLPTSASQLGTFLPRAGPGASASGARGGGRAPRGRSRAGCRRGLAPPGGAEGRAGPAGPCRGSSRAACLSSGASCRLRSLPSKEGEERRDPAHLRIPAAPLLECGSPVAPAVAQGGKGRCGGPLSTPSCLPAVCCCSVTPASTLGIHAKVAGTTVLWSTPSFWKPPQPGAVNKLASLSAVNIMGKSSHPALPKKSQFFSWCVPWNRKALRLLKHQRPCFHAQVQPRCELPHQKLLRQQHKVAPQLEAHSHATKWPPVQAVSSPCGLGATTITVWIHPKNSVVVFKTLGKHIFGLKNWTFFSWPLQQLLALGWREGWRTTHDQVTTFVYTTGTLQTSLDLLSLHL